METTGSIPACTGEADQVAHAASPVKVYPRMHGGSLRMVFGQGLKKGLSPHARGKHRELHGMIEEGGSIPACTGEAHLASRA